MFEIISQAKKMLESNNSKRFKKCELYANELSLAISTKIWSTIYWQQAQQQSDVTKINVTRDAHLTFSRSRVVTPLLNFYYFCPRFYPSLLNFIEYIITTLNTNSQIPLHYPEEHTDVIFNFSSSVFIFNFSSHAHPDSNPANLGLRQKSTIIFT